MRNTFNGAVMLGFFSAAFFQGCAKPEAQAPAAERTAANAVAGLDVTKMDEIPVGNYVCNLLIAGVDKKLNFDVVDNELLCVEASERGLIGLRGRAELIGNGVFLTQIRNEEHIASQFWVFEKDGTAAIKEIPDRGEKQRAVPVKGKTLEIAAKE
jgi:hypothetical protein